MDHRTRDTRTHREPIGPENGAELGFPYICRDHSEKTANYIWIKTSVLLWKDCCRLLFSERGSSGHHLPLYVCIIGHHQRVRHLELASQRTRGCCWTGESFKTHEVSQKLMSHSGALGLVPASSSLPRSSRNITRPGWCRSNLAAPR